MLLYSLSSGQVVSKSSFLCDDWCNWHEQMQEMPREFCTPEPDLFSLTAVPIPRLGAVPQYVTRVRTALDALKNLVSMQVFYNTTSTFFRNLEYLTTLASSCQTLGELLAWPVLLRFGTELSDLARRRRLETISFSPEMIEGFVG